MGLIEVASDNSVWRGMDYYNDRLIVTGQYVYFCSIE